MTKEIYTDQVPVVVKQKRNAALAYSYICVYTHVYFSYLYVSIYCMCIFRKN